MKSNLAVDPRLLIVFTLVLAAGVFAHATPMGFEAIDDTGLSVAEVEQVASTGKMELQRQEIFFDGERVIAFRIRVPKANADLRVLPSKKVARLDQLFEKPNGDFVAMNGGFYDQDLDPMGLVVSGAKEHIKRRKVGGSGIIESRSGKISILHQSRYQNGADEALQSIDRIVAEGKSLVRRRSGAPAAARTVVALGKDYLWTIVVVSEKSLQKEGGAMQLRSTSQGLPLWATARYVLETTDVVDALNLDGGISTQIIARVDDQLLHIRGVSGTINGILVK